MGKSKTRKQKGGKYSVVEKEEKDSTVKGAEGNIQNEISYGELQEKYLRLYSEFDNFRRRTAKEKLDIIIRANGDVIIDILPILDDFERAIITNEKLEDIKALKEGFELIFNKMAKVLEKKGLKPMAAMGAPFDTDHHEAITNISVEDENQKGKVVDVLEKGYMINNNVLRFAKVVVGN